VLGKRARGKRIGRTYVEACRGYLERHVMPYLGHLRISEFTPKRIEQMIMDLRKKNSKRGAPLSTITINQILASLKIIFREGVRLGELAEDPSKTIEPLEEIPRERSFLTPQEVRKLFNARSIRKVWSGDRRNYTLSLLAASTGMRLGEIQALQVQYVSGGFVKVEHGWTRYGIGDPKRGSKRTIPLPSKTRSCLRELMELSPYQDPEDLVFWGADRRRPIAQTFVLDHLYQAFAKIGILDAERAQRNINFHSWRHFFNTALRGRVPDAKLQALTGHRTLEMTENYTHFRPEDFKDVLAIQEQIV
jgi:integrase